MKKILLLAAATLFCSAAMAQEPEMSPTEQNTSAIVSIKDELAKLGSIKISGYVQGQWQWANPAGATPSGFIRTYGDAFSADMNNRFNIRRGRIKFTYTKGTISAVIQPDFTEKGVAMKDAYVNYTLLKKTLTIRAGLFDRPFGYEIEYSSSQRESAERSRTFLALFPGERGVGAKVQLKGSSGLLSMFTLDAGLFNGNGIAVETDSYKDFIGKLAFQKNFVSTQLNLAVSLYQGTIWGRSATGEKFNKYSFTGGEWKKEEVANDTKFARQYLGFSGRIIQYWGIGTTNLVGEVIMGQQPSGKTAFANSAGASFNGTGDIYLRQFRGGYAMLVQDLGFSKSSIMLKYDSFNPNTKISLSELNAGKGTAADVPYTTVSVGYLYRFNESLRLMAQYDMTSAKKTDMAAINDFKIPNILTIRAQVKF